MPEPNSSTAKHIDETNKLVAEIVALIKLRFPVRMDTRAENEFNEIPGRIPIDIPDEEQQVEAGISTTPFTENENEEMASQTPIEIPGADNFDSVEDKFVEKEPRRSCDEIISTSTIEGSQSPSINEDSYSAISTEIPVVKVIHNDKRLEMEECWALREKDDSVFGKISVQDGAHKVFDEMSQPNLEEDLLGVEGTIDARYMFDKMPKPAPTQELVDEELVDEGMINGSANGSIKTKMFGESSYGKSRPMSQSKNESGAAVPPISALSYGIEAIEAGVVLMTKANESFPSKIEAAEVVYHMFDEMHKRSSVESDEEMLLSGLFKTSKRVMIGFANRHTIQPFNSSYVSGEFMVCNHLVVENCCRLFDPGGVVRKNEYELLSLLKIEGNNINEFYVLPIVKLLPTIFIQFFGGYKPSPFWARLCGKIRRLDIGLMNKEVVPILISSLHLIDSLEVINVCLIWEASSVSKNMEDCEVIIPYTGLDTLSLGKFESGIRCEIDMQGKKTVDLLRQLGPEYRMLNTYGIGLLYIVWHSVAISLYCVEGMQTVGWLTWFLFTGNEAGNGLWSARFDTKKSSNKNEECSIELEIVTSQFSTVVVAKTPNFVWDPGQNGISLCILEDKDVLERVGKDIVLMDTTLGTTEMITTLGGLYGQSFWDPGWDTLYAPRFNSDKLEDTVGALDDIGLIRKTLIFLNAKLEHYIWDPGSSISVSQLFQEDFDGDFSSHHLEDKVVVEGRDLSRKWIKMLFLINFTLLQFSP